MEKVTKVLYKKSGIYCIINLKNQKRYVGSSKNIYQRLQKHRAYLRKNMHENQKLQNSWNKYGEDVFQYYVLEFCSEEDLTKREQFYIDTLKPEYNLIREVIRIKMSEESRQKMSKSRIEGFKKGTVKLYQEKPIYQYSLNGEFIQGFNSIKEAAEKVGIARTSINRFLSGTYKKGGNFLWSLTKEDFLKPYKKIKSGKGNCKPVEVLDLLTNTVSKYNSLNECGIALGKNITCIHYAMQHNVPYLKRYMIKYTTAVS